MSQLTRIHVFSFLMIPWIPISSREKYGGCRRRIRTLLLTEGLAVGTLIHSRICLMGTHQDALQGAEVCVLAVMSALGDSTLNALVCMAIHGRSSFWFDITSMPGKQGFIHAKYMRFSCCALTFLRSAGIIFAEYANFRKFVLWKAVIPSLKRKEFCHDL